MSLDELNILTYAIHASFLMLFGVTDSLIDVNAAQSKLVLLENFNENYSKCLRLLMKLQLPYKVNAAEGVNAASEEVSTAELIIDYAIWEVIENGANLPKIAVVEGVEKVMPITSAEDKTQIRLEVKARSTLMIGIPNEHQLKFNSIKDASKQGRRINDINEDKDITLVNVQDDADNEMFDVGTVTGDEVFADKKVAWYQKQLLEAVEKRFGGNAATKKTQRNLLKQKYENFIAPSSEMLDQTFNRLQKLVSLLELLD
ncbi:hypothetical protein Tco_0400264 [Tanacetum coccineum]